MQPKNLMQNFNNFLAGMIRAGTVYSSQGQGRIPLVDVRDIAAVAAQVLRHPSAHITGRPPRRFADCATDHAPAWN